MLSDVGICDALDSGDIDINPRPVYPKDSDGKIGVIQPASVDLRLSQWIRTFTQFRDDIPLDPYQYADYRGMTTLRKITGSFILHQGQLVLASTIERLSFSRQFGGRLEGKSSLGRLGLIVHSTAGFFDPGFRGYPTLEISLSLPRPILLYPGMTICQMAFFKLDQPASFGYEDHGKYSDQDNKPNESKYWMNKKP